MEIGLVWVINSLACPKNDHEACCLSRHLRVEVGAIDP